MTEKRFNMEYVHGNPTIWHITDCGEHIVDEKICDLLNALHEENVKLQARNKYLATKIQRERNSHIKQHEKWEKEIKDENEELKQFKEDFIKMLDDITSAYVDLLNESWEENEQLKSENIDLRKDLGEFEKSINIQGLIGENEQLKHQNELLSDELEQCKAVIEKRWSEYLKKKELKE